MTHLRIIGAMAAVLLVNACAGFTVGYDIDKLRKAEATGDAFTRALTEEYRDLMIFEADKMYDWRDAGYYARKGLRAAAGEQVDPQPIEERKLPADKVGELTSARAELVSLLDASARTKFPKLAAQAQARFDCWMEQKEENHQPEHIAACRKKFQDAIEALRVAMAPPAAPKKAAPPPPPEPAKPETFLVYFAFDSQELTAASNAVLDNVMKAVKKMGAQSLAVTGHADRAGPEEYNLGLSLRRASSVLDGLAARGANPADVSVAGRGEAEPAVATADGVPEAANRRVEIIVLP